MTSGTHSSHARGENHYRWSGGPDPAKRRANAKASSARYPERRQAREKVKDAVRSGKIPPAKMLSCVDCGESAKRYDHFAGYDKPLEVQAVCYRCDGKRVRARGELRGKRGRGVIRTEIPQ